jgi:hypothetical protein
MKHLLPSLLALLVAACAADHPAPVTNAAAPAAPHTLGPPPGSAAASAGAPRVPRAPRAASPVGIARFNGTYRGVRTVLVSGGADCGNRAAPRNLVVEDGQARIIWNPGLGSAFVGSVAPDGALALTLDQPPAPTELTGAISGSQATGRATLAACQYEMTWRRAR